MKGGASGVNDWKQKFEFSRGANEAQDLEIIKSSIIGCVNVEKSSADMDKMGIDYVATLRNGALIYIDAKRREAGASRYWKHNEPEFALETWSVMRSDKHDGKAGWTLSESSNVDMILYAFDNQDWDKCYLLPFQFLRMAFRKNFHEWTKKYHKKTQANNGWTSEAVFVPASVVLKAISEQMEIQK